MNNNFFKSISAFLFPKHNIKNFDYSRAFAFLKYIGPGLLVTVGFIDPGNWGSNIAAGSEYGYKLLWMITFSTIMLIVLQHNVAHLGIATGKCLSESISIFLPKPLSKFVLSTAVLATISTSLAEILGGALALNMIFGIKIELGALIITLTSILILISNTYKKLEKIIIFFVSLIGISFLFELKLIDVNWNQAFWGSVTPYFDSSSLPVTLSVLGAIVMPHNLFLHSEIIQSREWNKENDEVINQQLKYEFLDTFTSMIVGWAINSAMVILAAATFFEKKIKVTELQESYKLLIPLLGNNAALIFSIALLFSGLSSSITAGMAGGSIYAGIFNEPYDIKDRHSKIGVFISLFTALIIIFFIKDTFKALVISQMLLSFQLPFTIAAQIYLTSSEKVMGKYKNKKFTNIITILMGVFVSVLNIALLIDIIFF